MIFIDSPYPSTFLCEDSRRVFFSYRDFTGTKVVSVFISPINGLEFSRLIPCFPVVLFWHWTAGIRLLVALWVTHDCFRCCVLIYFIGNSLGVWFFFSIAALTSKRSLVLMPESSAEEITVCPGKHPTVTLLTFWSLAIFVPINLSDFSTPLPGGLCVIDVCVYHHTQIHTDFFFHGLWLWFSTFSQRYLSFEINMACLSCLLTSLIRDGSKASGIALNCTFRA